MPDESKRAELLREVELYAALVESQLNELRHGPAASRGDLVEQGQAHLHLLNGLKNQLTGSGTKDLTALRAEIGSAIASAHAYASEISTANAAAQQSETAQVLSLAEYKRQTADWDRKIAQTYVQEAIEIDFARGVARSHGMDIGSFEHERSALQARRDEAKRKGDKVGERTADALLAQNTLNIMTAELDGLTDPAERTRQIEEMQKQQRILDERRAALTAQIELEARRIAAERGLTADQTATLVAGYTQERLHDYDAQAATLSKTAAAAHAELETAVKAGLANQSEPASRATSPISLSPNAKTDALAAVSPIKANFGSAPGGMSDFDATPAQSQIALASSPDAHKTVEVPQAGARPNAPASPSTTLH